MLIFDRFRDRRLAEEFAAHVKGEFQKSATVCDSQDESDQHDPFPFALDPPIVLVERDDDLGIENEIECSVDPFGGQFAGT